MCKNQKETSRKISLYSCPPCRNTNPHVREPQNGANQTNHHFDFLQHLASCKSNLSLLGNIPRGARITAADALNDLINDVIRTNSSLAWMKLLCFTFHGLQKPKKEKSTSNSPSLVTKIKNQISTFINSSSPTTEFPFQLRRGE